MNKEIFNSNELKNVEDVVQKCNNVCILVDYDNLYHSMREYGVNVSSDEYNFCQFINEIYGKEKIRTFRAYADFEQVNVSLRNLQEQRVQIRNVYGNNKEDKYRKNASDIELSMDAIEMTHRESNIDTYVIVTSDSDMIPVMSRLKYKGKKIHLYYTSSNVSQTTHFNSYCDFSCDLMLLFNINIERKSPEYWFEQVKQFINNWHIENNAPGKRLGFKWLRDGLSETLFLPKDFVEKIIEKMKDENIITKGDDTDEKSVNFQVIN